MSESSYDDMEKAVTAYLHCTKTLDRYEEDFVKWKQLIAIVNHLRYGEGLRVKEIPAITASILTILPDDVVLSRESCGGFNIDFEHMFQLCIDMDGNKQKQILENLGYLIDTVDCESDDNKQFLTSAAEFSDWLLEMRTRMNMDVTLRNMIRLPEYPGQRPALPVSMYTLERLFDYYDSKEPHGLMALFLKLVLLCKGQMRFAFFKQLLFNGEGEHYLDVDSDHSMLFWETTRFGEFGKFHFGYIHFTDLKGAKYIYDSIEECVSGTPIFPDEFFDGLEDRLFGLTEDAIRHIGATHSWHYDEPTRFVKMAIQAANNVKTQLNEYTHFSLPNREAEEALFERVVINGTEKFNVFSPNSDVADVAAKAVPAEVQAVVSTANDDIEPPGKIVRIEKNGIVLFVDPTDPAHVNLVEALFGKGTK